MPFTNAYTTGLEACREELLVITGVRLKVKRPIIGYLDALMVERLTVAEVKLRILLLVPAVRFVAIVRIGNIPGINGRGSSGGHGER